MHKQSASVDLLRTVLGVVTEVKFVDQTWRQKSLCTQADPNAFFPDSRGQAHAKAAKKLCRRCPVTAECLEYALSANERFGVWGNTTALERRAIQKSASTTRPAAAAS